MVLIGMPFIVAPDPALAAKISPRAGIPMIPISGTPLDRCPRRNPKSGPPSHEGSGSINRINDPHVLRISPFNAVLLSEDSVFGVVLAQNLTNSVLNAAVSLGYRALI